VVRGGILQRSCKPTARLVFELELARQSAWLGPRFAAARQLSLFQAFATDVPVQPPRRGLGYAPPSRGSLSCCSASRYFHSLDLDDLLSLADPLFMQGVIRLLDDRSIGDWF
jgi:hypothetical protein